jgi:hypothetical protein
VRPIEKTTLMKSAPDRRQLARTSKIDKVAIVESTESAVNVCRR